MGGQPAEPGSGPERVVATAIDRSTRATRSTGGGKAPLGDLVTDAIRAGTGADGGVAQRRAPCGWTT